VAALVPDKHIPNWDDSIAQLENAAMYSGNEAILAAGQDDVIHAHSHIQFTQQKLQPIADAMDQGQSDPQSLQQAYHFVQIVGQHIEQHVFRLAKDPTRKAMAKMFNDQLQAIVAFSGKLRGAIRQAMREQQIHAEEQKQATALNALDQAKVQSIQTKTKLDAMRTQAKIHDQSLKTAAALRTKAITTAEQVRLDRLSHAADMENDKATGE
jgi:hypothetical protein